MYLHLGERQSTQPCQLDILTPSIGSQLNSVRVPNGWTLFNDEAHRASFVKVESWNFRDERGLLEVVCEKLDGNISWSIISHGCKNTRLPMYNGVSGICQQAELILEYVEKSSLCPGFAMETMEPPFTIPILYGPFKTSPSSCSTNKGFSLSCNIFSSPGKRCANCSLAAIRLNQKKERRLNVARDVAHPNCNKRYLSKDQVVKQLKAEQYRRRLAENREKYWKEKFQTESIEVEKEDNDDLMNMFSSQQNSNVPEDMKYLWDQQQKINSTKSKKGYRWHPK